MNRDTRGRGRRNSIPIMGLQAGKEQFTGTGFAKAAHQAVQTHQHVRVPRHDEKPRQPSFQLLTLKAHDDIRPTKRPDAHRDG